MLIFKGEVLGRFETKYKDEEKGTETKTKKIQVMEIVEGRRTLTDIKINDNEDIKKFTAGKKIIIPVKLYTPKDRDVIYISQDGDIQLQDK